MTTSRLLMTLLIGGLIASPIACADRARDRKGEPVPATIAPVPPERGPVPPPQRCDLGDPTGSCPAVQCGGNGPLLTGFEIDELNLDGCRNRVGIRVVPGSLRATSGACPVNAMLLDLAGGELLGHPAGGAAPGCSGPALVGATFWIEGPPRRLHDVGGTPEQQEKMTIVRQELRIRAVGSAAPVVAGPPVPSYALEKTGAALAIDDETSKDPAAWYVIGERVASPHGALCVHADQWLQPWAMPDSVDQQVLAVAGETYLGSMDLNPQAAGPRWFHLACAGSALAKMRLMGYDALAPSSTADERVATLKMLTATYCLQSYTVPGVPIFMEHPAAPDRSSVGPTELARIGPIEARWTAKGASCISHSRLWRTTGLTVPPSVTTGDDEAAFTELIRTRCGIPACAASAAGEPWATFTVDHVSHRRLPSPRAH